MDVCNVSTKDKYRAELKDQIKKSHDDLNYTYVTQQQMLSRLIKSENRIKLLQIILSAVTTVGIVGMLISDQRIVGIISAATAAVSLALNLYTKDFRLSDDIGNRRIAIDRLWLCKQHYESLMTDFTVLENDEITKRRDNLINELSEVYKTMPRSDKKSYNEAKNLINEGKV